MTKVTKIVTDGGSNYVCAFKDRVPIDPDECAISALESSSLTVVSLSEILPTCDVSDYRLRPHQICGCHRLNNIMNADVEAARKRINQSNLNGEEDEEIDLGKRFFEKYDSILKEYQRLWSRQQKSSVGLTMKSNIFILETPAIIFYRSPPMPLKLL